MGSTSVADAILDAIEAEEKELLHYGRKGMRWGVRRTPAQLGRGKQQKTSVTTDDGRPVVKISKRGGRIQKVDVDVDGDGKSTPSVINVKTQRVRARSMDAVEKERIEKILNEFGTEGVSNEKLRAYSARVELEAKINKLNPPQENAAKKFVKDMIAKDRETVLNSGDFTKTTTYAIGAAALTIAGLKAKKQADKPAEEKKKD